MLSRLVCIAFLVGCGGRYGAATKAPKKPKRGIEAAALPYAILDRGGRQVDTAAFWAQVDGAQVVCVGEEHPNPHHHWFQLEVMKHVAASRPGAPLALGMEMFQRPFQGVLDDYAAKRIDDAALLSRSGYEERWSYDWSFYRPTVNVAVSARATLLALNTPTELTKQVVRKGLESLTPAETKQLPELVLDDAAHRAWFDGVMAGMGGAHGHSEADAERDKPENADAADKAAVPSPERIYTAQVMWDEFMADGAATWVKANPQGLLVLLAGNGHCHDSAIVNRIKRRGVDKVIAFQPVLDTEGRVADALVKPNTDYIVVLQLPADVKAAMAKH